MWIRKGVKLLDEKLGTGPPVGRQRYYVLEMRITLSRGDVVQHPSKCLGHVINDHLQEEDDGFLRHQVRIDRENLVGGIFYAVQGMNVGGYRRVQISPHLAYGERGIPGVIPENAKLTVEIKVVSEIEGG